MSLSQRPGFTFLILFSFVISLALAGCTDEAEPAVIGNQTQQTVQTSSKEPKTIKIGAILPMSGPAAAYGVEGRRVIDYRVQDLNSQSQVSGYKVEVLYEDGQCNEAVAASALKKFVETDGIHFVLGGGCSSESLGIAPLLKDKDVIALTSTSSSPDINGKSPNLFSLSYSDTLIGEQIASQLAHYTKVAIVSEKDDYNMGVKSIVKKVLKTKYPSVKIVADEEFETGVADVGSVLEKLKKAEPEAVFLNPNVGLTAESLLKALAGIQDWHPQFISHFAYMNDTTLAVAPQAAEGMILVDAPVVSDPGFVAYKDKIIAMNGTLDHIGTFYTAMTLDGLDLLVKLIEKYDGNVSEVQKELSTGTFESEWGGGSFLFGGQTFVKGITLANYQVKGGRPELLL